MEFEQGTELEMWPRGLTCLIRCHVYNVSKQLSHYDRNCFFGFQDELTGIFCLCDFDNCNDVYPLTAGPLQGAPAPGSDESAASNSDEADSGVASVTAMSLLAVLGCVFLSVSL